MSIVHLPGLRRALRNDVNSSLRIKPRRLSEVKSFGEGLHKSRDADLVDHFRQLPGAGGTHEAA